MLVYDGNPLLQHAYGALEAPLRRLWLCQLFTRQCSGCHTSATAANEAVLPWVAPVHLAVAGQPLHATHYAQVPGGGVDTSTRIEIRPSMASQ